jgi:hypothetical protein
MQTDVFKYTNSIRSRNCTVALLKKMKIFFVTKLVLCMCA